MTVGEKGTCGGRGCQEEPLQVGGSSQKFWPPRTPLPPPARGDACTAPLAIGRVGVVEKNWQMRASKVLRNGMFSFLSNFNLSLTSLRSFPAGLAPLRARPALRRPGADRCFWWYSPHRSGISIPGCCGNTSPWKYLGGGLANAKANTRARDAAGIEGRQWPCAHRSRWERGTHTPWGS